MAARQGSTAYTMRLRNAGLTNHNSEDLGVIASFKRKNISGYCSSFSCAGPRPELVKKPNSNNLENCRDCGSALFFK